MAEIDMAAVDAKSPETPEIINSECTEENTDIMISEDEVPEPETIKVDEEVNDTGGCGLSNYELRWNDHIPYFTSALQSLREQNELTDITFACEDGVVGAHKLVLSSCSPYLRALFARLAVPHPVIFLRNTPRILVHHLMEFVYSGIVSIPEGQLAMVLNLGHSLQIQGLTMLKLSRENEDSASDEVADEIGSEPQLLPGEIRPTPDYALHNGEEMEYDAEGNKIEREKILKPAKVKQTVKDGDKNNSLPKKSLDAIKKRNKLKGTGILGISDPLDNRNNMYNPSEYRVLGAYAEKYGEAAAIKFASRRYDRKVGRKAIETAQRMFRRSKPFMQDEATSKLAELIMEQS